ncbi:MAG: UPF0175 family protein [Defluviitaleaceae bacterium]|nr:UPF0175 family protein [Defluviitaleaceae bacterium]
MDTIDTMDTIKITLEIPKISLIAANISELSAATEIKKHLALYLFQERVLSFGKAAELAKMSKWDFMDLMGRKGITFNYGVDDYLEDLQTIEELGL